VSDAHEPERARAPEVRQVEAAHLRAVRVGHGANCSSIGSVIDTLFATAAVGSAVFAAVVAAMAREDARVVGGPGPAPVVPSQPSPPEPPESPRGAA
jgi:hypothetical protein